MKVLHLCASFKGGAGIACNRIHQGLLDMGVDSHLLTANKEMNPIKNSYRIVDLVSNNKRVWLEFKELGFKVFYKLKDRNLKIDSALFTYLFSPYSFITDLDIYKEADIIHIHWVGNFLDYSSFFKVNKKPIIWTLHDMNPFFPGNHYTLTEKEKEENQAIIQKLTKKKNKYFENQTIGVAATTQWMLNESIQSEILGRFPHELIHYSFKMDIFKPRDQSIARQILDLPLDKKIILFAVNNIFDERKGFSLLLEAIKKLDSDETILCVMGSTYGIQLPDLPNIHEIGFINDERLLSLVFSAADVFVTPAIEEAFGQTTIESLCCGTPVIGFDTGIIPEVIEDMKNGFICKDKTIDELANGLKQILQNLEKFDPIKISEPIRSSFSQEKQADKYLEFYKKISNAVT